MAGRRRAPSTRATCTGSAFLTVVRSAVGHLEAHVDEINALNVFPVPDGDTGTNMLATVRAALEEAEASGPDAPVDRIAAAVGLGALMGARGNSGVITSQILRGIAEALAGKRRFNGLDLANALATGARTAYGAVGKPVEGTILTVIREASAAAVEAAERDDAVSTVLAATVEAAHRSVERTPSLLPILREAGVVDSGGQGLFRLFEGALLALEGRAARASAASPPAGLAAAPARPAPARSAGDRAAPGHGEERVAVAPAFRSGVAALGEGAFGYETVFVLAARDADRLDVGAIQAHLEAIGTSVLVGGDERLVKVHVHNERPDEVIAYGLSLGTLTRITIENLDTMADDVREAMAAGFVDEPSAGGEPETTATVERGTRPVRPRDLPSGRPNGSHRPDAPTDADEIVDIDPALGPAIVAVVAGDGLEKLFRDFGVEHIVRGGQAANPSTGELLRLARLARAREVIVLPNNPNVRLAAEQAARLCADRRLVVVPTRNAAEGIAALLAFDPDADAAANVEPMTEAGRGLATIQVTEAVRDAKIGGRKVRKGQTIVLDPDDGLVAANADRDRAVLGGVAAFPAGVELVTLYYGSDATLEEAEATARKIGERLGAEVEVVHGGQPHYRYLISAE